MATTEEDWVTGPALITAKALRALRVGDRVKYDNGEQFTIAHWSSTYPEWFWVEPGRWVHESMIVAWQPQRPEEK